MSPLPVDLPIWIVPLGAGLAVAGLAWLLWALLWDWLRIARHRTALRCPKCWYNMCGSPTLTCPECGHTAKSPRHLLRARRRWRAVAPAVILTGVGIVGAFNAALVHFNWIGHCPTFALLWMIDDLRPARGNYNVPLNIQQRMAAEVWGRYGRGQLSLAQRRAVVEKQFEWRRPPFFVRARGRWPGSVPVWVEISTDMRGVAPRELRATPRFAGGQPLVARDAGHWAPDWPSWPERGTTDEGSLQCIGAPPDGATQIQFDTVISESGVPVWTGVVTTPLQVGGTVDEILTPVRSPEVDAAVQSELAEGMRLSADRTWTLIQPSTVARLAGMTLGFVAEITCDGQPVASAEFLWTQPRRRSTSAPTSNTSEVLALIGDVGWEHCGLRGEVWRPLTGEVARLRAADLTDPRWQVRVRGAGALALTDALAESYWAGTIEFPARTLARPLPHWKSRLEEARVSYEGNGDEAADEAEDASAAESEPAPAP